MGWRTEESSCGSQPKEGNDPSLRSLRSLGRAGKVSRSSTRSREAMLIAPLSEHVGESCSRPQGKMTCWWLEFDWFKGESSKTLKIHNEECLVYLLILHIAEMLGESNRVPRFSLVAISSLHLSFGLHVQRCSKFGSVVIFILSCSRSAFDKLKMDQQDQQVRSSLLKSHIGESLLQHSSQVKPMPYFGGWCGSHVGSETESKLCALASSWQKLDAKNCYGCKIAFWVPLSFLTVSQCCLSCSTSNPKIRNHPKPQPTTESHTEARAEAALRPIGISNLSAAFALHQDIPKLPNQWSWWYLDQALVALKLSKSCKMLQDVEGEGW